MLTGRALTLRLFATIHPAVAVAVGAAAVAVLLMLTGLVLSVTLMPVMAGLLMPALRMLVVALMLGRRRLGRGGKSERQGDRGSDDLHALSPEFRLKLG